MVDIEKENLKNTIRLMEENLDELVLKMQTTLVHFMDHKELTSGGRQELRMQGQISAYEAWFKAINNTYCSNYEENPEIIYSNFGRIDGKPQFKKTD